MAITLTERAATRVQNFLKSRGKGVGLRLGVKTSGCSGMAYSLEFADELDEGDLTFESFVTARTGYSLASLAIRATVATFSGLGSRFWTWTCLLNSLRP